MKLSIITCTYNSEKYLQECIDSVKNQNLDSSIYEYIFIDGFSSDQTIDIINQYKEENSIYNISILQKKPKGIYNAMNEGIRISQGEYITFLNSDDYYNKNVLHDYLDFIEQEGEKELYYGVNNMVDSKGKFLHEYPHRSIYKKGLNPYILAMGCYVSQSNTLYKRELHHKYGLYNENLKLVSDAEFFIKLAKGKISNKFYDNIIANFRVHDLSASNDFNLQTHEINVVRINIFGKVVGTIMNFTYLIVQKILKVLH